MVTPKFGMPRKPSRPCDHIRADHGDDTYVTPISPSLTKMALKNLRVPSMAQYYDNRPVINAALLQGIRIDRKGWRRRKGLPVHLKNTGIFRRPLTQPRML